jgi:hypothetical protein
MGREDVIRDVFQTKHVFTHRKQELTYVPDEGMAMDGMLVGRIGRTRRVEENESPENGLVEITREPWVASLIIVDPAAHDDGQKIGFEEGFTGTPLSILGSFFKLINEISDYQFVIEISPIVDKSTFWDFEKENRGDITSVTFELLAPNMFGSRSALDEEMKSLSENEKAREVSFTIKNKDGLDIDSNRTRETVDFALRGGGNIRAKARKKKYNSKKNIKTITVKEHETVDKRGFYLL